MTSDANPSNDITLVCDDSVTRRFAAATVFWGLVTAVTALGAAITMLLPELRWLFGSNGEYLSYGRVRPIYTTLAVYGFAGNAAFAAIYYTTQRLCKRRMWSDLLSQYHFLAWQVIIVFAAASIPLGMTQGKPFTEAEWPIDLALALTWILLFGVNFLMTIATRREKQLYISLWFYIATVVSVGIYQIGHALVANVSQWRSDSMFSGATDALIHSVFVHNTMTLLLTMPFLGLIYYFAPKMSGRPIYSYKLAIAQFWGVVLFFCWAGPSQLHLTVVPEFASSLAMIFGLMLWMPLWGGVVNGLMTIQGENASSQPRSATDLIALKLLAIGIVLFGLTTFCHSLTSIKSVSAVLNFTDWVSAQLDASVLGSCGLLAIGMLYWLAPRLFTAKPLNHSFVGLHFWLAIVGVLLVVIPGYAAGLWQGLSLGGLTSDLGQLVELEFLNTVEQVAMLRWLRLAGLALFAAGMLLMTLNFVQISVGSLGRYKPSVLTDQVISEPRMARPASRFADTPMLEVAKDFDVWKRLDWHRVWERDAGKFIVLPLVVIAVATMVQLGPAIMLPAKPLTQPFSPLELAGQEVFRAEGCVNCHTQMVRPLVAEVKRFGDFSQPGEFAYSFPSTWGNRRVGPDLAREGGKNTSHWHWVHLRNPRDADWGDPRSLMPSFAHLASEELNFQELRTVVKRAASLGAEYAFDMDDVPEIARAQAEQIAADVVGGGGPIWTERNGRPPLMAYDSKAIALIAYLQRLGTDLYRPVSSGSESAPTADQTASNESN